ncbi:MAG TPA: ribosome-associated translation inhibitor RaiA [Candidatus Paceibacterota bacterium]
MTYGIKAPTVVLSPALREYAEEKIGSVEGLLVESQSAHAEIELEKISAHHHKGEVFRAEVNLRSRGQLYRAEATAEDLYAAIDLLRDELAREIKDYKTRKVSLFRRGARFAKRLLRGNKDI